MLLESAQRQRQDPTFTYGIYFSPKWVCLMVFGNGKRLRYSFKTKNEAVDRWNQLMLKRRDIRDQYKFYNFL